MILKDGPYFIFWCAALGIGVIFGSAFLYVGLQIMTRLDALLALGHDLHAAVKR